MARRAILTDQYLNACTKYACPECGSMALVSKTLEVILCTKCNWLEIASAEDIENEKLTFGIYNDNEPVPDDFDLYEDLPEGINREDLCQLKLF